MSLSSFENRSFYLEMALMDLRKIGFNPVLTKKGLLIPNFKLFAEKELMKNEGAPVPHTHDKYYHNYVYPNGLIRGINLSHISITKIEFNGIESISIPRHYLPADKPNGPENEYIDNLNFFVQMYLENYESNFVTVTNGNLKINLNGHVKADNVLEKIISDIFNSPPDFDPECNYVSDIGRIFPFIQAQLKVDLKLALKNNTGNPQHLGFLEILKDGDNERTIDLELPSQLFKTYIDKECRNSNCLFKLVNQQLKIQEMPNYIVLNDDNSSIQTKIQDYQRRQEPLYCSATSGGHAFAIMVDFKQKTLFVANPAGISNFPIIEEVKRLTGCPIIQWANQERLVRSARLGKLDVDDTCTADSLVLIAMMQETVKINGQLSENCLAGQELKTADYAWTSLDQMNQEFSAATAEGVRAHLSSLSTEIEHSASSGSQTNPEDGFEKCLKTLKEMYEGFILSVQHAEDVLTPGQIDRSYHAILDTFLNETLTKYPECKDVVNGLLHDCYQKTLELDDKSINPLVKEFIKKLLPESKPIHEEQSKVQADSNTPPANRQSMFKSKDEPEDSDLAEAIRRSLLDTKDNSPETKPNCFYVFMMLIWEYIKKLINYLCCCTRVDSETPRVNL